jgi:hypothetical protein
LAPRLRGEQRLQKDLPHFMHGTIESMPGCFGHSINSVRSSLAPGPDRKMLYFGWLPVDEAGLDDG